MDVLIDKLEEACILIEDVDVGKVEMKLAILERECPTGWYDYVRASVFVYIATIFYLYGISTAPIITYRVVSLSEYTDIKNKAFNEALYEVRNYD